MRFARGMRTLALAVTLPAAASSATAMDWNASIAAASNYLVHGLTRSSNDPTVQAHLGWSNDRNWSGGLWASTVKLQPGGGPHQEFDFYLARHWQPSRDWRFSGRLVHYEFRDDAPFVSYDYTEFAASASLRDSVSVSVAIAPEYTQYSLRRVVWDEMLVTYELSGQLPLNRHVRLTAGMGRSELDPLSYWYWSGGAEAAWRRLNIGVSYVGTDRTAEQLFGSQRAGDHWVATAAWQIH